MRLADADRCRLVGRTRGCTLTRPWREGGAWARALPAADLHLTIPNMDEFVESLNHHGYLLKKGHRVYKVQTTGL